nr:DDE-type integrase/transposase/recombinase [Acidisphaera sp. S103]
MIALVVPWRPRHKLACRDLPEMFVIRGLVFNHEAVRDWETELTPALAENLRRHRHGKVGGSWYVDETYIKVHGHWCYLYRAFDRSGALVDVIFSENRDMTAAKAFFEATKMVTDVTPDRVTRAASQLFARDPDDPRSRRAPFAIANTSITDWSRIIAVQKAATARCAGSRARDRLADLAGPTTSCVTSPVPVPKPTSRSPPTIAGSTSFAASQRF